jgi:integrase
MKLFTDVFIRGLKPPVSGRAEYSDSVSRGLRLRVTAAGEKTFRFVARPPGGGPPQAITLGTYPDLGLRAVRTKSDELRRRIAAGKNPFVGKQDAPAHTFAALAERYVTEYARRHKRSAAKDERNLRLHILPRWGKRDFASITRADVIALIERLVGAGTPVLANHVHRLISGIFTFAMDVALLDANPAARLRKRGAERVKSRVLDDNEVRLFWAHTQTAARTETAVLPARIALALRLVLATGVRPGEAAGTARTELEFDAAGMPIAWLIPGARTKNGRPHFVPLSPLASLIIHEALELAGDSPFVFPARGDEIHIDSSVLAAAMKRLSALLSDDGPGAASWRADLPTPHDLRRSCATRLAAAGIPAEDVAAILNHVRSDITGRVYDQYQRAAEKRRALDRWGHILMGIITPSPTSNVVALR